MALRQRGAILPLFAILLVVLIGAAGFAVDLSCWFKIDYQYAGTVNDTTTWAAFIAGNPIRLVE